MRIFEVFTYNLKQIKFKDNKGFFDTILKELKLKYSDIAFCFEGDYSGRICDKVIKQFPELMEYKQYLDVSARYFQSHAEYRLSSSYTDEHGCFNLHIKQEYIVSFEALLKKIPHTISFGFMGVVLDNIDWYGKETQESAILSCSQRGVGSNYQFGNYFSNSIRFFKAYDYGNKINLVELMIERREENGVLKPYPVAFSQILAILGKPKYKFLKCRFQDSEEKKWGQAAKKIDGIIASKRTDNSNDALNVKSLSDMKKYLIDSVTPAAGFSSKAIFNKSAKKRGYQYISFRNGCYSYSRRDEYNHTYTVEIVNIPYSSFFEGSVSVKGYNFKHWLYTEDQVVIKDAVCAEEYADRVFEIALQVEKEYAELLASAYGETPVWFVSPEY